jgi:hypothetical protein
MGWKIATAAFVILAAMIGLGAFQLFRQRAARSTLGADS